MKVNTTGVRLREQPTTESAALIESIPPDAIITPLDTNSWQHVSISINPTLTVEGWVAAQYLTQDEPTPPQDIEQQYTLSQLFPLMQDTFPPRLIAAIAYQESGFKNYRVHYDGTGHGLFGLDDNGLLYEFEAFSRIQVGRGSAAIIIPIEPQIEYARFKLQKYSTQYESDYTAVRIWHTGEANYMSQAGANYEALIRQHEISLFQ